MKVQIIAVGRMKAGPESDLAGKYFERFGKAAQGVGLGLEKILELPESRAPDSVLRRQEEGRAILERISAHVPVMALDERGKASGSVAFSKWLSGHRDQRGGGVCLVLGGPDGLDEAVRQRAEIVWSFGQMTWPHQLARIMLAEQLYRASSILAGHPYHRA